MEALRIAAFSDGDQGGNPAGVVIAAQMPEAAQMREMAAQVGYSETAFVVPQGDAWRVRYFSPRSEVPFCGHATIALGAALADRHGDGVFNLVLNDACITVEGRREGPLVAAALQSPPTRSAGAPAKLAGDALELFGYSPAQLDPRMAPTLAHAGADHLVLLLHSRQALSDMRYPFERGRALMEQAGLVTIMLAWAEGPRLFHSRNAFASGGVYEDAATGAATAAFAGALRDIGWPHGGDIDIVQGEDMGSRSRLHARMSDQPGSSIRVSGTARFMAVPAA